MIQEWRYCPKCKSVKFKKYSFRRHPRSGEKVARPVSLATTLFAVVPLGLILIYLLTVTHSSAAIVFSIAGLAAVIAGPFFVRRQNLEFKNLPVEHEYECLACHYRWPKQA